MAAPNIVNVATITGKTAVQIVGTSATTLVSNGVGSNKVIKINALYAGNIDSAANFDLTVDIFRSSTAYRFVPTITIPFKATLDVISKPIYLEEGDSIRLTASSANKIEVICSYEEIS